MKRIFCLTMLLTLTSCIASADVLWGKTETGQSVEKLQELYPEGKVVEPTPGKTLKNGASQRYGVSDIDVNGNKFNAAMYFKGDSLEEVHLSLDKQTDGMNCNATYNALHDILSGKYGAPVSVAGRVTTSGIAQSTFSSGSTAVSTFGLHGLATCSIIIFYRGKSSGASANL